MKGRRATSSLGSTNNNGFNCLFLTICAMTCCLLTCVYISYHSYFQLGFETDTTRLFINNKVDGFEKELNALLTELDGNQPSTLPPLEKPIEQRPPPPVHALQCPKGELLSYWKPCTKKDYNHVSPFKNYGPQYKYVTFEPDVGGWNNIRMQMELVLVFAAATGRTLVLPPDQPMYLLNAGKGHQKAHNFADFFPFDLIRQRLPVITMEEFMAREAVTGKLSLHRDPRTVYYPPGNKTEFVGTDKYERWAMWFYLRNVSACPSWKNMYDYLVIPEGPGINATAVSEREPYKSRMEMYAANRKAYYYDEYWQQQKVIHFMTQPELGYRLLEHFYVFLHFHDPAVDRLYKRFVRDYVHYIDIIFCKAALIINKLFEEGRGRYSAFHIRRGEFQYKEVKIPADQMLANVGQFIPENELLYLATDEKNKSFFNAFKGRFPKIRYLDDYFELANLHDINPNFLGMIDQIVCTRGSIFIGTWFSTFSGYITRMRGYLGYNDATVYYGDKNHRDRFHVTELPKFPFYMREWNLSWVDIDD